MTLHPSERLWLAAALRSEMPAWYEDEPERGEALLEAAARERVIALLNDRVLTAGTGWLLPMELTNRLRETSRVQAASELARRAELGRILRCLNDAKIPVLLLKGNALAYWLYSSADLRPCSDVDLLLPDVAAIERSKPALAALGYTCSPVPTTTVTAHEIAFHQVSPSGNDRWIDAHWALSNQAIYANRFTFDELWQHGVAISGLNADARALGKVHAMLHACMHRVLNMPEGNADRLIWLYDLHLLVKSMSIAEFSELTRIARERGLADACLDGLQSAIDMLHTAVPPDLMHELEVAAREESFDVRKARRRWYIEWHNLRSLPPALRWTWAWEKLFPSRAYMKAREGLGDDSSLLLAYLRRLGHGARSRIFRNAPRTNREI